MHSAAVYNSTWRLENNVKKAWNKLHNDIAWYLTCCGFH